MKDKEKQIEEMAKDIIRVAGSDVYARAEYLIEHGWVKLTEGRVILTRRELEDIKKNEYRRGKTQQCWDIKKKSAKKVLDRVYDYGQDYFVEEPYMVEDDFNQMLNELAKQFGGEKEQVC